MMSDNTDWISRHAEKTLMRLLPRVRAAMGPMEAKYDQMWEGFEQRLRQHWERLFRVLLQLYGWQYDFFYQLEQILVMAARRWAERPEY